jgi:hypothetical protein
MLIIIIIIFAYNVRRAAGVATAPIDEPLWFMRSCEPPWRLDTEAQRFWAIDIPALNRWIYWTALKISGLDRVPDGEPRIFEYREGAIWSKDRVVMPAELFARRWEKDLKGWETEHGTYAPRHAILLMRAVNLLAFAITVCCLLYAARLILRTCPLAAAAIIPILGAPSIRRGIAFYLGSGDIFLLASLAGLLAFWLKRHLAGRGAGLITIVFGAGLCGLATSAKHTGVLAVLAFMTYLAAVSKGPARLWNPLIAASVAFAVFALLNPVVLWSPEHRWPWEACVAMIRRRNEQFYRQTAGIDGEAVVSLRRLVTSAFWWWPAAPLVAVGAWRRLREPWFLPLALWAGFLIAGAGAGLLSIRIVHLSYVAPLDMALLFAAGVCLLAHGERLPPRVGLDPGDGGDVPDLPVKLERSGLHEG